MGSVTGQVSEMGPDFSHHLKVPYPPAFVNFWEGTPNSTQRFKQKTEHGRIYLRKTRYVLDTYREQQGLTTVIDPCSFYGIFRLPKQVRAGMNLGGDLNILFHALRYSKFIYRESCIREVHIEYEQYHSHGKELGEIEFWLEGLQTQ